MVPLLWLIISLLRMLFCLIPLRNMDDKGPLCAFAQCGVNNQNCDSFPLVISIFSSLVLIYDPPPPNSTTFSKSKIPDELLQV